MYSLVTITNEEGLAQEIPIPSGLSPIRETHWRNSRLALRKGVEKLLPPQDCDLSLEIEQHHFLKERPSVLVSLAHTRGGACAVAALKGPGLLGIGVDIEKEDRIVKTEILNKFINPFDQVQEHYLDCWCAKEAAFKASSFFWNQEKTFILKDVIINLRSNSFEIPGLLKGELFFQKSSGFKICVAIISSIENS